MSPPSLSCHHSANVLSVRFGVESSPVRPHQNGSSYLTWQCAAHGRGAWCWGSTSTAPARVSCEHHVAPAKFDEPLRWPLKLGTSRTTECLHISQPNRSILLRPRLQRKILSLSCDTECAATRAYRSRTMRPPPDSLAQGLPGILKAAGQFKIIT